VQDVDQLFGILGIDLKSVEVRLYEGSTAEAFGVSSTGASLIRPDGYIAWRSHDLPANVDAVLVTAFAAALASRLADPSFSRN